MNNTVLEVKNLRISFEIGKKTAWMLVNDLKFSIQQGKNVRNCRGVQGVEKV